MGIQEQYITTGMFFTILVIHWIADFVLQTHEQSIKKSSSMEYLLLHTSFYSFVWLLPACFLLGDVIKALIFCIITFIAHTITDYFTSRINKRLWQKQRMHDFFVCIGFDQLLHYLQLIITLKLLMF